MKKTIVKIKIEKEKKGGSGQRDKRRPGTYSFLEARRNIFRGERIPCQIPV